MPNEPRKLASAKKNPQIELFNDDGLVGMYADVFLVATQQETSMLSIAFYQSDLVAKSMDAGGQSEIRGIQRGNLVSRILMSEKGAGILFKALQDHIIVVATDEKAQEVVAKP